MLGSTNAPEPGFHPGARGARHVLGGLACRGLARAGESGARWGLWLSLTIDAVALVLGVVLRFACCRRASCLRGCSRWRMPCFTSLLRGWSKLVASMCA